MSHIYVIICVQVRNLVVDYYDRCYRIPRFKDFSEFSTYNCIWLYIQHPAVCGNLNHSFFISRGEALEVFQLPEGLILDKVSCLPIKHSITHKKKSFQKSRMCLFSDEAAQLRLGEETDSSWWKLLSASTWKTTIAQVVLQYFNKKNPIKNMCRERNPIENFWQAVFLLDASVAIV